MSSMGFDTELQKALLVVTIGAGGLVVSHANDSAFWVVTQLTGMDVKTGYKLYSLGTFVVGLSCALLIFMLSLAL
jgi:GntP family gluconate:H+ symporter